MCKRESRRDVCRVCSRRRVSWFRNPLRCSILPTTFSMYALRRHRRQLLFPPGLLALAFLLLLGCWVVGRQAEWLKQHYVLEVTAMPLAADQALSNLAPELYQTPAELENFRPWQTVHLTGNAQQDALATSRAKYIARQLRAAPDQDQGLRIRFADATDYKSLVQLIDYIRVLGLQKYFLDSRQGMVTLYAFTSKPQLGTYYSHDLKFVPFSPGPCLLPEAPAPFWSWLGDYLSKLFSPDTYQPLLLPDWRHSLYLLLLLGLISFGRLFRQWRQAQE
ncbi:hypothetical protein [Hymenobacter cellulosivorans]|uniref:Uncharacterized protein n=1 Tax=Hymenobacter cellulosivorans TaxID=2932249 RepID=A0ABY4FFW2_9BACT|nr:hypothetical protein [Hymenobacter cellulosivorans]UOQ55583.1 hypothetical protein MUN80_12675 [Hymenobacter cellulosivorans]